MSASRSVPPAAIKFSVHRSVRRVRCRPPSPSRPSPLPSAASTPRRRQQSSTFYISAFKNWASAAVRRPPRPRRGDVNSRLHFTFLRLRTGHPPPSAVRRVHAEATSTVVYILHFCVSSNKEKYTKISSYRDIVF
ncbi:hypothetical protein EVAR_9980_1 [Eumeta japonica]|uniref:Uncharacterized protein n=1 Tax=Eumeta variegata TaxID=151549 RepID=A0A4C1TR15_EUMVA|nr:hypothetical protein EVAR_9980_1 [Eumeta japonica]